MTNDSLPLAELLQKAGDGDFLRAVGHPLFSDRTVRGDSATGRPRLAWHDFLCTNAIAELRGGPERRKEAWRVSVYRVLRGRPHQGRCMVAFPRHYLRYSPRTRR